MLLYTMKIITTNAYKHLYAFVGFICISDHLNAQSWSIQKCFYTFSDVTQVTLSGQLVLSNLLAEHLECRILPAADETSGPQGEGQHLIALGRSTLPSVLFNTKCKMVLRIRFDSSNSVWSGDIPLRENCRSGQPWLVKVPLYER